MYNLSQDLQTLIKERFDEIEENIDQFITKKLTEHTRMVVAVESKINNVIVQNKLYADSIKKNLRG